MNEFYNAHYITLDENNLVIGGFSDAFREPQEGDICINDKGGYQFRLVIDGKLTEENPPLYDFESRAPLYKYEGNKIAKRSDEELEAERKANLRAEERERHTARQRYQPGDYVSMGGTLYRVTLPIPAGSAIAPGANCEKTSIVDEIKAINQFY